ncbi:phosphopantetheine-binding protein [Bacillus stercoris]|nr:phosphopantetheine-binding protein [Bacillus stercoris]
MREHAARQLPDYMVPAYFTDVTEIPLTPSGKVDRRKLFALEVKAVSGTAYTAPRNETEKAIAAIWQDVLNVEKAGIFDNFFETGGYSLKAMTLLTKIHKETSVEIPLQYLFEHPTIAALAQEADHRESRAFSVIEPAEKQEHYPLSGTAANIYRQPVRGCGSRLQHAGGSNSGRAFRYSKTGARISGVNPTPRVFENVICS